MPEEFACVLDRVGDGAYDADVIAGTFSEDETYEDAGCGYGPLGSVSRASRCACGKYQNIKSSTGNEDVTDCRSGNGVDDYC